MDYLKGEFVILLTTKSINRMEIVESIFNYLHSQFITNAYVFSKDFQKSDQTYIHTYSQYSENQCNRIRVIESCIFFNGTYIDREKRYFALKPRQFHRCPLYVGLLRETNDVKIVRHANGSKDLIGFEANIVKFIATVLNFTLKIVETKPVTGMLYNTTINNNCSAYKLVGRPLILPKFIFFLIFQLNF